MAMVLYGLRGDYPTQISPTTTTSPSGTRMDQWQPIKTDYYSSPPPPAPEPTYYPPAPTLTTTPPPLAPEPPFFPPPVPPPPFPPPDPMATGTTPPMPSAGPVMTITPAPGNGGGWLDVQRFVWWKPVLLAVGLATLGGIVISLFQARK